MRGHRRVSEKVGDVGPLGCKGEGVHWSSFFSPPAKAKEDKAKSISEKWSDESTN